MTERERYLEILLFGKPDRIPFMPGGPRESTLGGCIASWDRGIPTDVGWNEFIECRDILARVTG